MSDVTKLYAAFKAGYLGNNILDTYFSFFANIIMSNDSTIVEDEDVAKKFYEQYGIKLPLPFVRQVLGVGLENHSIISDHGKYVSVKSEMKKYRFNETDFTNRLNELVDSFGKYCSKLDISTKNINLQDFILSAIDNTDYVFDQNATTDSSQGLDPFEYAWFSFVKKEALESTDMYTFIASLSLCNITNQLLFYVGDQKFDYTGLNVYLDSPIVFALLGMDEKSRIESYKTLVEEMKSVQCSICVFEHNFREIQGIIERASMWATSTQYDMAKANKVARFFHDSEFTDQEITEFCGEIEEKLNEYGINVVKSDYDMTEKQFQEDEEKIYEMIKEKYHENGYELLPEKEQTGRTDIRSIIMIYRKRRGSVSTTIGKSGHIMLTSNSTIANVSKRYESNQSTNSGHIPACISVDIFGAVLWLNQPMKMVKYQKNRLLADCYDFLNPSQEMLELYIKSLDDARKSENIDEKKFLFLRSHPVVRESLMNITRGDYARFNSNTYKEVYEDIEARSLKQYRDESIAHETTKNELQRIKEESAREKHRNEEIIQSLQNRVESLENEKTKSQKAKIENRIKVLGWILTIIFAVIPCFVMSIVIEICKLIYINVSNSNNLTWHTIAYIALFIVAGSILSIMGKKLKALSFEKARAIVEKRM